MSLGKYTQLVKFGLLVITRDVIIIVV